MADDAPSTGIADDAEQRDPLAALADALARDARTFQVPSLAALAAFLPELLAPREPAPAPQLAPAPRSPDEIAAMRTLVLPKVIRPAVAITAGADFSFTVPDGCVWAPYSISGLFTSSVQVATRVMRVQYADEGGRVYMVSPQGGGITASTARTVTWYAGAGISVQPTNDQITGLPSPILPVPGGHVISGASAAIQSNDQWTVVCMYVLEIRQRSAGELAGVEHGLTDGYTSYPGIERFVGL